MHDVTLFPVQFSTTAANMGLYILCLRIIFCLFIILVCFQSPLFSSLMAMKSTNANTSSDRQKHTHTQEGCILAG